MLKTNSKKALSNADHYLFALINWDSIAELTNEDAASLQAFADSIAIDVSLQFLSKIIKEYASQCGFNLSIQSECSNWLRGLPDVIDTWDYLKGDRAIQVAAEILEETPEEASKYDAYDAEKLIDYLLFKRINYYANLPQRVLNKLIKIR